MLQLEEVAIYWQEDELMTMMMKKTMTGIHTLMMMKMMNITIKDHVVAATITIDEGDVHQ